MCIQHSRIWHAKYTCQFFFSGQKQLISTATLCILLLQCKAICASQYMQSFDTLLYFACIGYLKKQAGPATTHITTKASIKSFYEKDVGVVGVLKSNTTKDFKAFQEVAETLRSDFEFGHVTEPELVEGVSKTPSVLLFKNYDDQSTSYTGKFSAAALTEWIEEISTPKLVEMDQ